jgi:predicted nucleotidyltransferase
VREAIPHIELPDAAEAALRSHPDVSEVRLIGSRADGRAHELSDWDFAVTTDDFESVARDLPTLVAQLAPLAQQWDPYAPHACYMLMLPGPIRVDFLFLDEHRAWSPAWSVSAETLLAIDRHFWDWILWLEQKRRGGHTDVVGEGLENLFRLMLDPMGVESAPKSVEEALASYLHARERLERRFSVAVPRRLQDEVVPVLEGVEQA